ncbi:hypothetical protein [Endozoicomonas arenosclerae]|uniref:hypothetical protein n=1 Tax=Endozoicomonas arenosclerae TaxID=1633495 RepID=UPI0007846071|nr:hypothetical protein [Endozoicomonas arenosclerae]
MNVLMGAKGVVAASMFATGMIKNEAVDGVSESFKMGAKPGVFAGRIVDSVIGMSFGLAKKISVAVCNGFRSSETREPVKSISEYSADSIKVVNYLLGGLTGLLLCGPISVVYTPLVIVKEMPSIYHNSVDAFNSVRTGGSDLFMNPTGNGIRMARE